MKKILEWFRPVERVEYVESDVQKGEREKRELAKKLADVSKRVDEVLGSEATRV